MHPIAKPSVVTWGAGVRTKRINARHLPSLVAWGGVFRTLLPSVLTWTLPPVAPLYVFAKHLDLCPVPGMTTLGLNEDFWKARLGVCACLLFCM